jgi:hypothetical protein
VIRSNAAAIASFRALGRLKTGVKNGTERLYETDVLEPLLHTKKIQWYKFEGLKFRLADNTFYTPDFIVMDAKGYLAAHEVKGFWTEDARVKIKVAASLYPFEFIAIKRKNKKQGGGWDIERF